MSGILRLASVVVLLCGSGCVVSRGMTPIGNHSSTELRGNNFKVTRTGLSGEASCLYVFGLFPTGDPAIASRAMDDLVTKSTASNKSQGLINFAGDSICINYLFVRIEKATVRADAVEFTDASK